MLAERKEALLGKSLINAWKADALRPTTVKSLEDLARLAGVSKATASYALRGGSSQIPQSTCERIKALAVEHDYRPNQLVAARMSEVSKGGKSPAKVGIAFVSPRPLTEVMADAKTPIGLYYLGALEKSKELGFELNFVSLPQDCPDFPRLGRKLAYLGVEGVLLAPPMEVYPVENDEFGWDDYSLVSIEHGFMPLNINAVCNDEFETISRAIELIGERGIEKIGIAIRTAQDRRVKQIWKAAFLARQALIPEDRRIGHFITDAWSKEGFLDWFKSNRPEVILCVDDEPMRWLEEEGVHAPENIEFLSLFWLPNRPRLAGYYQNHKTMGRAAVELLSEQLYRNERG
ncbi:MAG: LacI family DNA-binding transcriptional regulator, partial [Verrucomicrobiota bacterium]